MSLNLQDVWRMDPLKMKNALWPDVIFYDKQVEMIYSVRDNDETFVVAGNMLGKDFVAAFIVLWFFLAHYKDDKSRNWCRIITTSVAEKHLETLWAEIGRFLVTSTVPLMHRDGGPLYVTQLEIRHVNELGATSGNVGNFIKGMVSGVGEGMSGHHAEHTLFVVDEASGVDDKVYSHASEWAKRKLIFGNPNPCTNFFYRGVKGGDILA